VIELEKRGAKMAERDQVTLVKVKSILSRLCEIAPGKSVEVRVPPYAAVQCVEGLTHRRGTPPNVVEMEAETLFQLAAGEISWKNGIESGVVTATGGRSDIGYLFDELVKETRMEK
jgi:hypothetical protein